MCKSPLHQLLVDLPKCEHHMHLEGSLSPELLFELAAKNDVTLPQDDPAFASVEALYERYDRFTSLDDVSSSSFATYLPTYFPGLLLVPEPGPAVPLSVPTSPSFPYDPAPYHVHHLLPLPPSTNSPTTPTAITRRAPLTRSTAQFLHYYYVGFTVLVQPADFEALASAYLAKAAGQGVRHAELFFDPQPHVARGIDLAAIIPAFSAARRRAEAELGITSLLIPCLLRHLPVADGHATFRALRDGGYYDSGALAGLGLCSRSFLGGLYLTPPCPEMMSGGHTDQCLCSRFAFTSSPPFSPLFRPLTPSAAITNPPPSSQAPRSTGPPPPGRPSSPRPRRPASGARRMRARKAPRPS